ncbi:hypothetical protein [Chitinophaga pinensis]|uniref:Carboxypeptidase regulatory-like domain-containing protein n=1 Tax=Chitinophaga pinensis TaxID=79329 RepID=A0A5C6LL39_9BACT|nr:hypothetical protein [Chitinophaga pinensis]TWV93645.1 hypothetical protein FEF09_26730 [Chitinophaga pinensis]
MKCILTESDGYFNYMGLPPGNYIIQPDKAQLKKLKLKPQQAAYDLHISTKREGDVIDDILFILERK